MVIPRRVCLRDLKTFKARALISAMNTPKKKNPSLKAKKQKKQSLTDLRRIMAKLRGPAGCPWDREQTENTLKKYLLEEAHEVLEALEAGTPEALREELGDLLLQIVFLCRIAEEKGQFNFSDVVHSLAEKLRRRHPHVFLSPQKEKMRNKPKDAQEVVQWWRAIKELEGKNSEKASLLDGLPLSLPALERAQRISERASRMGFDWPNSAGVWTKVQEELAELEKAGGGLTSGSLEDELGDLFFTLVNWARFQGLSAEGALHKATHRFGQRFQQMEWELRRRGRTPQESTLEEMDRIWNEIKKRAK